MTTPGVDSFTRHITLMVPSVMKLLITQGQSLQCNGKEINKENAFLSFSVSVSSSGIYCQWQISEIRSALKKFSYHLGITPELYFLRYNIALAHYHTKNIRFIGGSVID